MKESRDAGPVGELGAEVRDGYDVIRFDVLDSRGDGFDGAHHVARGVRRTRVRRADDLDGLRTIDSPAHGPGILEVRDRDVRSETKVGCPHQIARDRADRDALFPELGDSGATDLASRAQDGDHVSGDLADPALEGGQGPRLPIGSPLAGTAENVLLPAVFGLETEPVTLFLQAETTHWGVPHTVLPGPHVINNISTPA